jgi:hypothetical protein
VSFIQKLATAFRFCLCGYGAKFTCDWKVSADRMCDKPICDKHAKQVAPGKHLCPFHQVQYDSWKRKHPEKVTSVEVGIQESLFQEAV